MIHFCSCKDHSCPNNPHNQRSRGACDECIKKCLSKGEIPSCFFNAVSEIEEDQKSFTYEAFAKHVFAHSKG